MDKYTKKEYYIFIFSESESVSTTPFMKNIKDMTKDELIETIKQLQGRKKYGLVWEDKPEDVVEKCKEHLPVLEEVVDRAIEKDENGVTNLLIEGDNYHALSVLNYTHAGKIDVIYIDPPYNTGNKDFIYNDKYVDKEDSFRHSKWISFMDKRLRLARNVLTDDGVIFISIDDNELAQLKLLCDDVFGEMNYVETFIWKSRLGKGATSVKTAKLHEYILCYAKDYSSFEFKADVRTKEKDTKERLRQWGQGDSREDRPTMYYPIHSKEFGDVYPIKPDGTDGRWRASKQKIDTLLKKKLVVFEKQSDGRIEAYRIILKGTKTQTAYSSLLDNTIVKTTAHGSTELKKIFGEKVFDYPKPSVLIKELLSLITEQKENAIVLDFMAGSGTTGQAVMELNKENEKNHRFILCTNNENQIAEDITYPRVKNVIDGYADVDGISANLRYFKTTFVKQSDVSDDTRRELVQKSTEMICVKEGTYKKIYDNKKYKVYRDNDHITGILFDLDALTEFKEKIDSKELPANLYIFSLTHDTFEDDFASLNVPHTLCPIPESILEVYRKLFA